MEERWSRALGHLPTGRSSVALVVEALSVAPGAHIPSLSAFSSLCPHVDLQRLSPRPQSISTLRPLTRVSIPTGLSYHSHVCGPPRCSFDHTPVSKPSLCDARLASQRPESFLWHSRDSLLWSQITTSTLGFAPRTPLFRSSSSRSRGSLRRS